MLLTRNEAVSVVKPIMNFNYFDRVARIFGYKPRRVGSYAVYTEEEIIKIMVLHHLLNVVKIPKEILVSFEKVMFSKGFNYNKLMVRIPYDAELKVRFFSMFSADKEKMVGTDAKNDYHWMIVHPDRYKNFFDILLQDFELVSLISIDKIVFDMRMKFQKGIRRKVYISEEVKSKPVLDEESEYNDKVAC